MKINMEQVLSNKGPGIFEKEFNFLRENFTTVNLIKYMDFVRSQTVESILENSKYIYSVPSSGADFLNYLIKSNDLNLEQLNTQKENINNYYSRLMTTQHSNEHIKSLRECIDTIDNQLTLKNDPLYIKENLLYNLHVNYLPKPTIVAESSYTDRMDEIIQNINSDPKSMDKYQSLVSDIKKSKRGIMAKYFVPILVKNTSLVIGLTIMLGSGIVILTAGAVALILSLPPLIVAKLLQDGVDKKYLNSYITVIDKQILEVSKAKENANPEKERVLSSYIKSLNEAKNKLKSLNKEDALRAKKVAQVIKKKMVKESITEMNPVIGYESSDVANLDYGKIFKDQFIDISDVDDIADVDMDDDNFNDFEYSDLEFDSPYDLTDIDTVDDGYEERDLMQRLAILMVNTLSDETDDTDTISENFTEIGKLFNKYILLKESSIVTEGPTDAARKIALKGEEITKGAIHGIKNVGKSVQHVTVVAKRIPGHIDNFVNDTIDMIKKADRDERREKIVQGGWKFKLMKIIKYVTAGGLLALIHPAIAAVTLLAAFAIDKRLDAKVRNKILHELEAELKICNEKIEDARSRGDNEAKYKLMRLQHKLQDDITRIKYKLESYD